MNIYLEQLATVIAIAILIYLIKSMQDDAIKDHQEQILDDIERNGFFEIDDKTILAMEIDSTRVRSAVITGLHAEAFEEKEKEK